MKKRTKFVTLLAVSAMCSITLTAAVACSKSGTPSAEAPDSLTGEVLVLYEGEPESGFGAAGDLCFTAESGKIYRKNASGWVKTEFRDYTFENGSLRVTYPNGETGLFAVQEAQETEEHEHTFETEPVVIYESYCVVPGIGVKTCSSCNESFVEIIPAEPENHKADEENFGKCEFCGLLENGSSGFVINSLNVNNIQKVVEQLQDGDVIRIESKNSGSEQETPDVVNFTGATPFDIGKNKQITVDVKDVDVTFTSGTSSALSIGAGSTLNFTSESSEERPSINLDSATSKPAVSINGKGAVVNVEGVEINCYNTKKSNGDNGNPSIAVTAGGELNLGKGTVVNEKDGDTEIKNYNAYGLKASGNNSVIRIDGATINSEGRGAAVMAQNSAKIEFNSGVINVSTTDTSVGLCVSGYSTVEMTGGVINVTGDLTGGIQNKESRRNCAVAIGEVHGSCDESEIYVTGGVINLTPTAGRAYAIATEAATWTTAELSGDLIINVNAAEGAQAAAFAVSQGAVCAIYDNVVVDGWTAKSNKSAKPEDRNFFQWIDEWYNGDDTGYFASLSDFRTGK